MATKSSAPLTATGESPSSKEDSVQPERERKEKKRIQARKQSSPETFKPDGTLILGSWPPEL